MCTYFEFLHSFKQQPPQLTACGVRRDKTLEPFPTAEQMASWAGLCMGNRESTGIQKDSQTTQATHICGQL
jgi:hypothetical protein